MLVLLRSDDAEVEADEVEQEVTRSKLIAPIVDKLRDQAGAGQSVALVSVQGAVKEPGEYPLIRAGGLSFLVQLAGGLEDGAYLKEVEVRRINASEDGASVEILNASLSSESTFALQSRDVVRINFLPDWNPDAAVEILGEVRFPGLYALRDGETIGSLHQPCWRVFFGSLSRGNPFYVQGNKRSAASQCKKADRAVSTRASKSSFCQPSWRGPCCLNGR